MKNTRFLQSWTFLALIFGLAGFVRADAGARVTYLANEVQAHGLNGSLSRVAIGNILGGA